MQQSNNQYITRLPGWISSFLAFIPSLFNGNSEIIIHPNLSHSVNVEPGTKTIMLGALLPLSGASSSLGESEQAALQIAINDINKYFSENHSKTRFGCLLKIHELFSNKSRKTQTFVGYWSFDKCGSRWDRGYANLNRILLISLSNRHSNTKIRTRGSTNSKKIRKNPKVIRQVRRMTLYGLQHRLRTRLRNQAT